MTRYGDLTDDFRITGEDIDVLNQAIRNGSVESHFDLNGDSVVNEGDRLFLVKDILGTWIGDSTLDGNFNSGDLVAVLQAGEYEDNALDPGDGSLIGNSIWTTGDWNGDGDFDSGDLVYALQDGGYEIESMNAIVPEPSSLVLVLSSLMVLLGLRRLR